MDEREKLKFDWWRCGDYKIEMEAGRKFIKPVPESGHIRYDITGEAYRKKDSRKSEENSLVQSLLNLNLGKEKDILVFVKRFGLLGLLQHKYLPPQVAPFGVTKIVSESENEDLYLIPGRYSNELKMIGEVAENYLLTEDQLLNSQHKIKYLMSEPLDEFINAVLLFQEIGKWISEINKCSKKGISGPLRSLLMQSEHFKYFANKDNVASAHAASTMVSFMLLDGNKGIQRDIIPDDKGSWVARWRFESLLSAAYFFLTEDMVSNFWIGQCERCGKHFLSSVGTQRYCSRKCEDAKRKADSREKLKPEVIKLLEAGKTLEEILSLKGKEAERIAKNILKQKEDK